MGKDKQDIINALNKTVLNLEKDVAKLEEKNLELLKMYEEASYFRYKAEEEVRLIRNLIGDYFESRNSSIL